MILDNQASYKELNNDFYRQNEVQNHVEIENNDVYIPI